MIVRIVANRDGAPAGKLAEAEICFGEGLLSGLKLVGFSIWRSKNGPGLHVTVPARQYSVNGERRHYALLRAANDEATVEPLRERILRTYEEREARAESRGVADTQSEPAE